MEHLSHKRKITIMMAIIMAMFFSAINQTIVSTAMPRIIAVLSGMEYYSWVITIYMLTSTLATVLVGKLSDIYGRKPFILTGIVIFMIGAFLTGFSKDIYQLIIYRGVQGVGAGIIMASVFTAVGDLFSPRERGKWTGVMMAVFGFSSVIGPTLGGWLVDNFAWKWLFWIFLPLGVVAFFMILFLFPKVERNKTEKIDYLGSFFLSLTIIALLLGFSWAGTKYDWGSFEILGLFAAAVLCLVIFIFVERQASSPVLPLSLFKNDIVTISNAVGFIMNAGMMGALIYLPFFVQGVEGISPTYSGYVTMPMSIAMVIMSTVIGRIITKTGKYKRFALFGLPIMIAGMLIMAFMNSVWLAVVAMIVFGLGLGLGMPIFSLTVQNAVKPTELGVATASSQLFRNLGGTIGIAVMGTIMTSSLARNMEKAASSGTGFDFDKIDPALAEQLAAFHNPEMLLDQPKLAELQSQLPADVQPIITQLIDTLRDALSSSLTTVFLAGTALVVIALILTVFLREIPLRTSNKMPESEQPQATELGAERV
ncbi:DHA2 family efflux MFS transporter permease subunit [Paenibacillus soyae]|uniref:DHA2 family efflux MFS transporter permease subunit n=1 Tax=Paenibacillus soyae TaxID=2969249 RepID=A0A9X2S704_9BACL|nr:DHA2 family efflux MFS transporter permease subunit [Paenibacillus soyae]MCR2802804.1 DHA2 family efflux MFS transporter permease subunit [Paenibacillus soyae]